MIEQLTTQYSVKEICEALGKSRSSHYQRRRKEVSPREQERLRIGTEIERIFFDHRSCYGSPRITKVLKSRGEKCSENRVASLMRQKGLKAKQKRSFRPRTTIRSKEEILAPNRLKDLDIESLEQDQVWVSDITYIYTQQGWLYLVAIMDRKTRKIISWVLEDHMRAEIVETALEKALKNRKPSQGLIFHSDRGSQYTSRSLKERLTTLKITPSMSAIGYCYDNAAMESFWSSLKNEVLPDGCGFQTKQQARLCLFEYIEIYYNKKRLHSSLDYMSPEAYELTKSNMKN